MGFMNVIIVDAAAIGRPGEPSSAGGSDVNGKEPSSHSINKRSPIINPLFPVKVPATFLAAKLHGLAGGRIKGKIPGVGQLLKLFWFKKGFFSQGK